ncbi:MAG: hypothetical protein PHW72_02350 [Candidatus Pacebacteria bacterium]|nr:hypothetical protein [Candidatus Paceibacterota bacterium]
MPNKKVIDIISPQKKQEKKSSIAQRSKPFFQKEQSSFSSEIPLIKVKKEKTEFRFRNKLSFLAGGLIIIFISVFCYINLSKAEIKIWPETQVFNLQADITIDKNAESVSLAAKTIPGIIFEKEKVLAKNLAATGRATKEGKAEGTIRVYNEYSTASQVLIATTRFISTEGFLFRTPLRVVVPGATLDKGKLVPSYVDIRVVADEPGPEYNIGPSHFSIPGFAGTDRYTKFYAKSTGSMTGGFLQGASLVTKEDVEKAEISVNREAKSECEASLKNDLALPENAQKYIFFNNAIQTEIVESFSLVPALTEKENFDYQSRAKSKTLIFEKEDINKLVDELILSKSPDNYRVYDDNLKIDYTLKSANLNSGKMIISLDISATSYLDVDVLNYKKSVTGKSILSSKIFLENQPGVTRAQVDFWPFWVKRAPGNPEKINVELLID